MMCFGGGGGSSTPPEQETKAPVQQKTLDQTDKARHPSDPRFTPSRETATMLTGSPANSQGGF
jgi:hypothetical protein